MNTYPRGRIAILIVFEALTLAVIAPLHLSGVLGRGSRPFNPTAAGTAEAVIGIVLILGAIALLRGTVRGRDTAIAATAFAILGFLVGLSFTVRGGDAIDVAYHATLLPLLLLTLVALLPKRRPARPGYLEPPWMQRYVGNRLAPRFRPDLIARLSVQGRRTGRWHSVPIVVLEHDQERYLVSYRGASDWALNLQASHHARLTKLGRTEEITVEDVPAAERGPVLEAYRNLYRQLPTVAAVLQTLPDPADHPVFRIDEVDAPPFTGRC
jgi:deazaflavin-dependent oxidoreductase (nitroreductase family)